MRQVQDHTNLTDTLIDHVAQVETAPARTYIQAQTSNTAPRRPLIDESDLLCSLLVVLVFAVWHIYY